MAHEVGVGTPPNSVLPESVVRRYVEAARTFGVGSDVELTDEIVRQVADAVQSRPATVLSEERQKLADRKEQIRSWLELEEPLTLTKIHDLLVREKIEVSYPTLRRFVRSATSIRSSIDRRARGATAPGSIAMAALEAGACCLANRRQVRPRASRRGLRKSARLRRNGCPSHRASGEDGERLKLGYIFDVLPERLVLAEQPELSFQETMLMLLQDEITRRDNTASVRRAAKAKLDPSMLLERWDKTAKVRFDTIRGSSVLVDFSYRRYTERSM